MTHCLAVSPILPSAGLVTYTTGTSRVTSHISNPSASAAPPKHPFLQQTAPCTMHLVGKLHHSKALSLTHHMCVHLQAHEQGLSPWQLPSVRTSPPPKQPQPDGLSLEQLRSYQQHYPYSLEQQWQQQSIRHLQEQAAQQQLLQASQQQPLGRPASAGTRADYQPLLQQHLALQETLRQQQQQQPLPWHQHSGASPPQHGHHQQVLPSHIAAEPWHSGKPRWQSPAAAAAATGVWGDRRNAGRSVLIPAASSRSSSPSSSPSTISAVAGSAHASDGTQQMQRQSVDLHRCQKWADKAGKTAAARGGAAGAAQSPPGARLSSAGGQQRRQLPSYNGQVLPWEFAALV